MHNEFKKELFAALQSMEGRFDEKFREQAERIERNISEDFTRRLGATEEAIQDRIKVVIDEVKANRKDIIEIKHDIKDIKEDLRDKVDEKDFAELKRAIS